jgi:hypothetical protein
MYWTTTGSSLIQRAALDGSGLATVLERRTRPAGIALATLAGADNQGPKRSGAQQLRGRREHRYQRRLHASARSAPSIPTPADVFTYTIAGGADARVYDRGNARGRTVVRRGVLDFETQSSYQVTVRVTDSAAHTFDQTFTIASATSTTPANCAARRPEHQRGQRHGVLRPTAMPSPVSDADAATLQITLTVNHGALTLAALRA